MFCVESVLCERNVQEMIFAIVPIADSIWSEAI
jgi:hypothetical protein